jgi:PAS domain-containing protein
LIPRRSVFVRYVVVWLFAATHAEAPSASGGVRPPIRTFLKAAAAGLLFQVAKNLALPNITLRQSHVLTVVVMALAAAATHYFVVRDRALLKAQTESTFQLLFANNPLAMWVYDLETLRFLEVNDAAIAHYGYSRDEFLNLRLTDIRTYRSSTTTWDPSGLFCRRRVPGGTD